jgi:hypothetical protein
MVAFQTPCLSAILVRQPRRRWPGGYLGAANASFHRKFPRFSSRSYFLFVHSKMAGNTCGEQKRGNMRSNEAVSARAVPHAPCDPTSGPRRRFCSVLQTTWFARQLVSSNNIELTALVLHPELNASFHRMHPRFYSRFSFLLVQTPYDRSALVTHAASKNEETCGQRRQCACRRCRSS